MADVMEYDVVVVGAGPAGLSAAIRLKQLKPEVRVCVLEKGAQAGAHILSGCVFDPVALNVLFPDWQQRGAPLIQAATEDEFLFLTDKKSYSLPVPKSLHNPGNYIISLSALTRWLAGQAEALGVEIFAGFPAVAPIIEDGTLRGIVTGDMGRAKDGSEKSGFQPGVEIRAPITLFGEGCRGQISEVLMRAFNLRSHAQPQTYGLGVKEIWEVPQGVHRGGKVVHTVGWPLNKNAYGGGFLYHMEGGKVAVGLITGLDYSNPHLDPFLEFQRFKHHPAIAAVLKDGKRIEYGARSLNEGGLQSLPQLSFPGGMLLGCAAGFLNVARIKGSHMAMQSGIFAAEAVAEGRPDTYPERVRRSWIHRELVEARNIRPGFKHFGLYLGMVYAALEGFILKGRTPWTFKIPRADHFSLRPAKDCAQIHYPAPDGKLSFDRTSSVYLSNTNHAEDQPAHLRLSDPRIPVGYNLPRYDAPEQRYCPAGVYEIVRDGALPRLQINAQNCVHCKACDIKDPLQNITWTAPEGGGGPVYQGM